MFAVEHEMYNCILSLMANVFVIKLVATNGTLLAGTTYVSDEFCTFVPFKTYQTVAFAVVPPELNNCIE
ncbi:MAG: hypothetical protein EBX50_18070 [Chitinophagia bacterium]|nr:hypothetical protein [Chitinophagia bacterium]